MRLLVNVLGAAAKKLHSDWNIGKTNYFLIILA
jgi:hypothetical protein